LIHEDSARRLAWAHYALGVPAAIFAAFAGTAAVAGLRDTMEAWSIVGAGLATASSILAGLQTLLNFGGRTEGHRQSAAAYKRLIRRLERVAPEATKLAKLDRNSETYKEITRLEREIGDADSSSILPPRSVAKAFEQVKVHLKHNVDVIVDNA
jgi:hypothetical protein